MVQCVDISSCSENHMVQGQDHVLEAAASVNRFCPWAVLKDEDIRQGQHLWFLHKWSLSIKLSQLADHIWWDRFHRVLSRNPCSVWNFTVPGKWLSCLQPVN